MYILIRLTLQQTIGESQKIISYAECTFLTARELSCVQHVSCSLQFLTMTKEREIRVAEYSRNRNKFFKDLFKNLT